MRIILAALSVCALWGGCNRSDRATDPTVLSNALSAVAILDAINNAPRVDRVLNRSISLIDSLVLDDEHPIGSIDIIVTDAAGNILVSESPAANVHMLNSNLEYVLSFSAGAGRGPGELINPVAIETGPDYLLIVDMVLSRINKYDSNGHFIDLLQLDKQPYRVARAGSTLVVTVLSRTEVLRQYSVDAFDSYGEPEFQTRVVPGTPDPRITPLVAGGDSEYAEGLLLHSLTFLPAVITADLRTGAFTISPTIDAVLHDKKFEDYLPDVDRRTSRISDVHYSGPVFYSRGLVWIHSRIASTRSTSFIDRYRLKEGHLHYHDTIAIPGAVRGFTVNDRALYVTRNAGTALYVYEVG